MPKVSIIIPTYNRAHIYLPRAIRSVLGQTIQDFEIIVVDDASTDNTEEVVRSFNDPRIVYVRREKNGGPSAAGNTGIWVARGEYMVLLGDDNELLPKKLQWQLAVFEAKPQVGVVYGGWQWVWEDGAVEKKRIPDDKGLFAGLPRWRHNVTDDLLVRLSLAREEPFNESIQGYEDTDFLIRLAHKTQFAFVPQLVATCHNHLGPRVGGSSVKMAAGLSYIFYTYNEFLRREPRVWSELNFELGSTYIRAVLQRVLDPRYLWRALKAISQAMRAKPAYWLGWHHILTAVLPGSAQRLVSKLGFRIP